MVVPVRDEPQDIQRSVGEKTRLQHGLKVNDAGIADQPHKLKSRGSTYPPLNSYTYSRIVVSCNG